MHATKIGVLACVLLAGALAPAWATETENIGIQVLPAPGKVTVDGKTDDWDLSGGVFTCSDVENLRGKLSVWFHVMYDKDNLYLLARWNDETPMNNPGSSRGDYGFAGDCLQARVVTAPEAKEERCSHLTCWLDRDGVTTVDVAFGRKFDQGNIKNAQKDGAAQAFLKNADGKGYVQELALPWSLLCAKGAAAPKAGDRILITFEPNFCTEALFRITMKDVFKADIVPDRVFTFMSSQSWGTGTLEPKGGLTPRSLRLADGREFKVALKDGLPAVDWTGLIRVKELLGHKVIDFTMPEDGYVSVQIVDAAGAVVRELLNGEFMTAGAHQVKWDGLATPNWRQPGVVAAAGQYTWRAIWHKGIGLRLVGWAHNGGSAPWDGPSGKENWGGDHGLPVCADHDAQKIYLGWSGAEAGKALLACDLDGNVQWKNNRGGMAGCTLLAVDAGTVYAQNWGGVIYRLDAKTGGYTDWQGTDSTDLAVQSLWPDKKPAKEKEGDKEKQPALEAGAMHAAGGKLYVVPAGFDTIGVLDGKTGKMIKELPVKRPAALAVGPDKKLYVISEGKSLLAIDVESGKAETVVADLDGAAALAIDAEGSLYVGLGGKTNQVRVYSPAGKVLRTIGREGGRALLGKWTPDGMRFIAGLTVDPKGKLWVMESDDKPKRVSVWDAKTGAFVKEFFGPTAYGALGGAICPADPLVMVGQSCEWKLDAKTGQAACTGTITRDTVSTARFAVANGGRVYLAMASNWAFNRAPLRIYERVGEADYKLRTEIYDVDAAGKEIPATGHGQTAKVTKAAVWADENGDAQRQAEEVKVFDGSFRFSGWFMSVTPELALYSEKQQFKPAGFTACGAPKFDLSKPVEMPAAGLGSADGTLVLQGGEYGAEMTWLNCYDIASGKLAWRYPDNFNGVHGSHKAIPPQVGMVRGSFGPCGSAKLPEPVGNVWVIATNVGEWHILTGEGFYLARLFQGDPMKMSWPEKAAPGAMMDNCPPGMGGEDFGGSICYAKDGNPLGGPQGLYLQAGKTAFWNVKVVGLDAVQRLPGGKVTVEEKDLATAGAFRTQYLQEAVGAKRMTIAKITPTFTGNFDKDFKDAGAQVVEYARQKEAAVRSAATWDDKCLYLAWDVTDATPWINGAEAPEFLYCCGDSVDFQLATDAAADKNRGEPGLGDLRLSIGSLKGTPTAVVFRPKSQDKAPKKFTSGVVRDGYVVDSVLVLKDAKIEVKQRGDKRGYTVEAAIPLADLGLKPAAGLKLLADFGALHGDAAGKDTVLRTYWQNQNTGIVNDEVFELKIEPKYWGEVTFK